MGNIKSFRVVSTRTILYFTLISLLNEGNSRKVEGNIRESGFAEVDYVEYDYTSVLDTRNDTGDNQYWKILQGANDWFQYFSNISEIPEDVDIGEDFSYIVGFPKNFNKEKFLNESEADGIWMMVHSLLPPDFDDPVAHIDFTGSKTQFIEYDTINITCYLNGNSTLKFNISNSGNSNHVIRTFNNTSNPKEHWDTFIINTTIPFRRFILEIYTEDNSSFVMIEKIEVSKKAMPTTTTTEAPVYCTTPQISSSTTENDETTITDSTEPTIDSSTSDHTPDPGEDGSSSSPSSEEEIATTQASTAYSSTSVDFSTTELSTELDSSTTDQECIETPTPTTTRPPRPSTSRETTTRITSTITTTKYSSSITSSSSTSASASSSTSDFSESPKTTETITEPSTTTSNPSNHLTTEIMTILFLLFITRIFIR